MKILIKLLNPLYYILWSFLFSRQYALLDHTLMLVIADYAFLYIHLRPYKTSNYRNCQPATFKYHQNFHNYPLLLTIQPLRHQSRIFFNYYKYYQIFSYIIGMVQDILSFIIILLGQVAFRWLRLVNGSLSILGVALMAILLIEVLRQKIVHIIINCNITTI